MHILIADDHRLIVEAVAGKLAQLGEAVACVPAQSVEELFAQLAGRTFDLALIDLSMPGAIGQSHIEQVRERYPQLPVIVLSGHEEPEVIRAALDCGVMGFIPKAYSPDVMLSAVRLVLAGGVYVPPLMVQSLRAQPACVPSRPAPLAAEPGTAAGTALAMPAPPALPSLMQLRGVLTQRQIDVLHLLSQGKPNKLIGRSLDISEGTVKIHLAAIFRALKVRNRTEAVVAAQALTAAGDG